jgi:hypothetical protein
MGTGISLGIAASPAAVRAQAERVSIEEAESAMPEESRWRREIIGVKTSLKNPALLAK